MGYVSQGPEADEKRTVRGRRPANQWGDLWWGAYKTERDEKHQSAPRPALA